MAFYFIQVHNICLLTAKILKNETGNNKDGRIKRNCIPQIII